MAGEWIKLENVTPDKPEVYTIAETLGIDPDAVLGKLCRIWIWADEQTVDGNAKGNARGNATGNALSVTRALVDRISGVTGFTDAMLKSGWLQQTENGFEFPNFYYHNGLTAKQRALTAKRQRRFKAKSNATGNATGNGASVTIALSKEEKRREENIVNTDTPLPPKGGTDDADNAKPAKRTRKPKQAVVYSEDFLKFWAHYPKQQGKAAAADVFESLKPSPELLIEMIDTVERFKVTADWNRDGGQYIPHASTWLNQRRWEDKPTEAPNPHLAKTDKPKLSFKDQQAASALQFINSMTGNGNNGTQSLTGGHLDAIS